MVLDMRLRMPAKFKHDQAKGQLYPSSDAVPFTIHKFRANETSRTVISSD